MALCVPAHRASVPASRPELGYALLCTFANIFHSAPRIWILSTHSRTAVMQALALRSITGYRVCPARWVVSSPEKSDDGPATAQPCMYGQFSRTAKGIRRSWLDSWVRTTTAPSRHAGVVAREVNREWASEGRQLCGACLLTGPWMLPRDLLGVYRVPIDALWWPDRWNVHRWGGYYHNIDVPQLIDRTNKTFDPAPHAPMDDGGVYCVPQGYASAATQAPQGQPDRWRGWLEPDEHPWQVHLHICVLYKRLLCWTKQ